MSILIVISICMERFWGCRTLTFISNNFNIKIIIISISKSNFIWIRYYFNYVASIYSMFIYKAI